MKAFPDNKTVYINDFIKQKHKKRRINQFRVFFLQLTYYVSTTERQIIKLSYKYISYFNLNIIRVEAAIT